ncbi:uncharacterized protein LOC143823677 [Paroedura picta]|uniref:uncharacterized protein LOC143823677 n=1 Tax=Paroedura picta TaxID=143630 RepID=UPI0040567A7B
MTGLNSEHWDLKRVPQGLPSCHFKRSFKFLQVCIYTSCALLSLWKPSTSLLHYAISGSGLSSPLDPLNYRCHGLKKIYTVCDVAMQCGISQQANGACFKKSPVDRRNSENEFTL